MKPNSLGIVLVALGTAGLALVGLAALVSPIEPAARIAAFGAYVLLVAAVCLIGATFLRAAPPRPIVGRGTTANREGGK